VDELDRMAAPGRPPELQLLLSRHRSSLQDAIEAAFRRLAPEERTLLRLQYVDRLGIDELSTIYRAHRATVARRLLRLRDRMLGEVAKDLGREHGWSPATFRSVWKSCFGAIELSVGRLLVETKNNNACYNSPGGSEPEPGP
jgi:RNA polymerase sigma-70 factor